MKRKYKHEDTFNDTKPRSGSKRDIVKITDHVDVFKFKNSKYVGARLVGPVFKQALHWVRIKTKEGKEIGIPKKCFRYDPDSDSFDSTVECPYCDKLHDEYKSKQRYYTNAIIRAIEEDAPSGFTKKYSKTETKSGFKDGLDSKAWTPVRVLDLPAGVAGKIKGLADLNKHKVDGKSKAMPLSDEQYGRDIEIKYDKDAPAAQAYDVQKGDASPLDDEQQNYLHWDLEGVLGKIAESMEEDLKTAREEVKRLKVVKKKGSDDGDEYSDDGDADEKPAKKKAGSSKKPSRKKEESDEELSDESSDEGSDEKPAKKKAGSSKKPSRKKEESDEELSDESSDEGSDESSDEDSDEGSDFNLDEDSDNEDSDEKPAKKKAGSSKKPSRKKEESDDESSDEGSDESSDEGSDDSSDEESEEKPAKKSSKPSGKSSRKPSKKRDEDSDEASF